MEFADSVLMDQLNTQQMLSGLSPLPADERRALQPADPVDKTLPSPVAAFLGPEPHHQLGN